MNPADIRVFDSLLHFRPGWAGERIRERVRVVVVSGSCILVADEKNVEMLSRPEWLEPIPKEIQ